jgi:N utilization substance protein B
MIDRRQARILAMQALCQLEVLGDDLLGQLDEFLADEGATAAVQDYARGLVKHVWSNLAAMDDRIQSSAQHWDVKRMYSIDRNILRVAVCELVQSPELSPKVVINEAIEIAKQFGVADSPGFVNGLLDAIVSRRGAENAEGEEKVPIGSAPTAPLREV